MSFLNGLAQFWSQWGLRIYVLSSLSAILLLSLASWTRRRSGSGWRAVLLWAVERLLWLAYQLGAVIAATAVLGRLSLSGADPSAEEQMVIAFWAPLLLLHLGGPDTMTAYAMEDNTTSMRKFVEMLLHVLGASYALYKDIFGVGSWTPLATASAIMLPVGAARYVEKCYALWQSKSMMEDDGDKDDSSKKEEAASAGSGTNLNEQDVVLLVQDLAAGAGSRTIDDDVLRLAQDPAAGDDERHLAQDPAAGAGSTINDDDMLRLAQDPAAGDDVVLLVQNLAAGAGSRTNDDDELRQDLAVGAGSTINNDDTLRLAQDPVVAGAGSTINNDDVLHLAKDTAAGAGAGFTINDDDVLRLAQDLFHVCRRALADSSVARGSEKQVASEQILDLGWESMCKVVETELSLMYEALYTKAIVLHTCPTAAYLIRLLSPLATAAAVLLFNRYHAGGSGITTIRASFVEITYLLLGGALALDVVWLLRALGSSWTYAAVKARRPPALWQPCWLYLHRAVAALDWLDPMSWLLCSHPLSHRTWSGTIGRYNLLRECCVAAQRRRRPWWRRFWSWLQKKCELQETTYLSPLPEESKKLLMERVGKVLESARSRMSVPAGVVEGSGKPFYYTMAAVRTRWGHKPFNEVNRLFSKVDDRGRRQPLPLFAREFEEDVLAWHIATCVFFSDGTVKERITRRDEISKAKVEATKAMSEYVMFLVAVRRHMLPRNVLHSMFEASLKTLGQIWELDMNAASSSLPRQPEDKLADFLVEKKDQFRAEGEAQGDGSKLLVYDASRIAGILIEKSSEQEIDRVLDFIFKMWVDKLLYAAVRCSRESHAKQLSRGGELTTILWMIAHHAGLFVIGVRKPDYEEAKQ